MRDIVGKEKWGEGFTINLKSSFHSVGIFLFSRFLFISSTNFFKETGVRRVDNEPLPLS